MKKNILERKKFNISQLHINYLLNELRISFGDNFKIISINNGTTIKIYSQWKVLIVDFYFENQDIVVLKLSDNWSIFHIDILKYCILKTFHWDFVPENKCCCGILKKKNRLVFNF